jgi:hypothetical protein
MLLSQRRNSNVADFRNKYEYTRKTRVFSPQTEYNKCLILETY